MDLDRLLLAANETALMVDFIDLNRGQVPGQLILAVTLGVYLAALFILSLFASRKIENEEDFLVAGRRLGLFLCCGSLIATWFGADMMIGSSTAAREEGLRGTILEPWSGSFALIIAGIFYAPKLWHMKLLTTGDFFRRVYGPRAELVCCAVLIPSFFAWIAAQYLSLAAVQQAYFGVDERWAIVFGFAVVLIYTMVGGMWSVTLVDTVQILIAFTGLVVVAAASFAAFGSTPESVASAGISLNDAARGVSRLIRETPADDLTLLPPADASLGFIIAYLGTWATGLFGNLPGQDLHQRIFSAKDARTARAACIWSGIIYLAFGMIPVAIGLMSRLELPVAKTIVNVKVLMYMAGTNLNAYLAIIFVVSFVSIVMATACSAVLAPATILGHNLLGRFSLFKKNKLVLDRVCVLLISLGGLTLAYWGKSTLGLLDISLSLILASLFVPLTMGLYGKPRGELSAILAVLLGIVLFFARSIPEELMMPLPVALGPRGTVQQRFDSIKKQMTAQERSSSDAVRARIDEVQDQARADMQTELVKYVPLERAQTLTDDHFERGFEWLEYVKLRLSPNTIGVIPHQLMRAALTVTADWYGLAASFLGYFLGQRILKRRGIDYRPGALEPPKEAT